MRTIFYYLGLAVLAFGSGSLVAWGFPHQTIWTSGLALSVGALVGYLYTMGIGAVAKRRKS